MSNTFEVTNSVYIDEQSPDMPIVIYLDHDEIEQMASISTDTEGSVKLSFDLLDIIKNEIVSSAINLHETDLGFNENLSVDPADKALFARYRQKFEEAIALIDGIQYSDK
jgi:hypothetical protein